MKKIQLKHGKFTLVDDIDFKSLNQNKWYILFDRQKDRLSAVVRVVRKDGNKRSVFMHRQILGVKPGEIVDHINHNPLDNRRENLRIVTHRQNCQNRRRNRNKKSSRFKGVFPSLNRWQAKMTIILLGKRHVLYLGCYSTEREAAEIYDRASRDLYGDYSCLNFARNNDKLLAKGKGGRK